MIIELFGPPAAGKTTFAHVLVAQLRLRGHDVEPVMSSRPSELRQGSGSMDKRLPGSMTAVMQRVHRPLREVCSTLNEPTSADRRLVGELMRILPPSNPMWRLRLHLYLLGLSRAWRRGASSEHIVLFDQGFVQAVCTFAQLTRASDDATLAKLLSTIPASDVRIRVNAPRHIIDQRLRERAQGQSYLERLLEFDRETNLAAIDVIDHLDCLLARNGRSVLNVSSLDPVSPETLARTIDARARTRVQSTGNAL